MTSPQSTIEITENSDQVTLVNVFTVDPERQDELLAALDKATEEVFVGVPGFISANLHTSLDGGRVINYAQWSSEQAYKEALSRPDVREHIGQAAAIAKSYDPTLVRVRAIHHA
ncbi:antibiotic biosynthesis monooxygenase family protein [Thermocrispum municipale]|jgi:quinol monooxygenase YgiN|uniref:antibiotic biosynthesis monooxygenase family protein n=1 Tax=Thermocrispum municipale TaxID=37926 RepID=UPI00040BD7EA|nr:antibiotic biosynthesis monooxygenase family protein [Thermocrispum municipale]